MSSEHFPRVDPAMIVLVTDPADRCLLARNALWPERRVSILAGFVEAGESAEQAVAREVHEETGITVGAVQLPRQPAVADAAEPDARLPRRGRRGAARSTSMTTRSPRRTGTAGMSCARPLTAAGCCCRRRSRSRTTSSSPGTERRCPATGEARLLEVMVPAETLMVSGIACGDSRLSYPRSHQVSLGAWSPDRANR